MPGQRCQLLLFSLEKIDDYGAYQMTYYGDYGFDEFLEVGALSDKDIEEFVTKRLLKGIPINLSFTLIRKYSQ